MHESGDDVAVVDHVFTKARGARAVKSRAADLSAARDDEVTARGREERYAKACGDADENTQRHQSRRCRGRAQNHSREAKEHDAKEHRSRLRHDGEESDK